MTIHLVLVASRFQSPSQRHPRVPPLCLAMDDTNDVMDVFFESFATIARSGRHARPPRADCWP